MRKSIINAFLWLSLFPLVLFLSIACKPSPSEAGAACISVDLGTPSQTPPMDRYSSTYLLSFTGPTSVNDVTLSGSAVWVTLPAGIWTVRARAVDPNGHTVASGSVSKVEIAKDKTSPVSIALD